ncbi:hypothetical protein BV20DRAFT_366720 [Pilatotrama ljubarskyi]|nr:hypothetical protein BV20DRAFT_366720 [Pilatotrama ljubarskyi]
MRDLQNGVIVAESAKIHVLTGGTGEAAHSRFSTLLASRDGFVLRSSEQSQRDPSEATPAQYVAYNASRAYPAVFGASALITKTAGGTSRFGEVQLFTRMTVDALLGALGLDLDESDVQLAVSERHDRRVQRIWESAFMHTAQDGFALVVVLAWMMKSCYRRFYGAIFHRTLDDLNVDRLGTESDTMQGLGIVLKHLMSAVRMQACSQAKDPEALLRQGGDMVVPSWLSTGFMSWLPRCPYVSLLPQPPPLLRTAPEASSGTDQRDRQIDGLRNWVVRPSVWEKREAELDDKDTHWKWRCTQLEGVDGHVNDIVLHGCTLPLRRWDPDERQDPSNKAINAEDGTAWVAASFALGRTSGSSQSEVSRTQAFAVVVSQKTSGATRAIIVEPLRRDRSCYGIASWIRVESHTHPSWDHLLEDSGRLAGDWQSFKIPLCALPEWL